MSEFDKYVQRRQEETPAAHWARVIIWMAVFIVVVLVVTTALSPYN